MVALTPGTQHLYHPYWFDAKIHSYIQPGKIFQEGLKNVKWGHKNMKKI